MSLARVRDTLLAGLLAIGLAMPALAQESTTGDAGTLDKETAAKVLPCQAALLALRGPQFPRASALRRYASAHGDVF